MSSRACKTCSIVQPLTEYYKDRGTPRPHCKKCTLAKQAADYAKRGKPRRDPEARREAVARYNASAKAAATRRRSRETETFRQKARKRYATDAAFKVRKTLSAAVRGAMKRYGEGRAKADVLLHLLGCTVPDFMQHMEKHWKEGMAWENHGHRKGEWSIDHILPLASFDLTDVEQQRVAFHYSNQQPLWWHENLEKSDKMPDGSRGRYLQPRPEKVNPVTLPPPGRRKGPLALISPVLLPVRSGGGSKAGDGGSADSMFASTAPVKGRVSLKVCRETPAYSSQDVHTAPLPWGEARVSASGHGTSCDAPSNHI